MAREYQANALVETKWVLFEKGEEVDGRWSTADGYVGDRPEIWGLPGSCAFRQGEGGPALEIAPAPTFDCGYKDLLKPPRNLPFHSHPSSLACLGRWQALLDVCLNISCWRREMASQSSLFKVIGQPLKSRLKDCLETALRAMTKAVYS